MQKKKLALLALLGMIGLGAYSQIHAGCSDCSCSVAVSSEVDSGQMTHSMADCSSLSLEEMEYMNRLSDANRQVFCGQFSAAQRKEAMHMSGMPPDDAVLKVRKNHSLP